MHIWETKQRLDFPGVKFIRFRNSVCESALHLIPALVPEWGLPPEVIAPSAELPRLPMSPALKVSPKTLRSTYAPLT